MKTIYFDMDGTIADLYSVENWLPRLRDEDMTPYLEAKPMMTPTTFYFLCKMVRKLGYDLGVISWLSKDASEKYDEAVTSAKMAWLHKYAPALYQSETHFLKYGVPKMSVATKGSILLDDNAEVGGEWEQQGGIWVDVKAVSPEKYLLSLAS